MLLLRYKNKWGKMSPAAKASVVLIIVKFIEKGLSMITGPIFTRIMPIDQYGIVSTFTSWQGILYIIATLNLSQGVFNNGMLDFREDRNVFCFSILCLANIFTLMWVIIYVLINHIFGNVIGLPFHLLVLMVCYFLFLPAYNFWMGRQRFEFKYKANAAVMIGVSLISTIVAIVAVLLVPSDMKSSAKIIGAESITILVGVFFYFFLLIKAKHKVRFEYWKYVLKFNLPLIPHYLSMYVLASSDRIMISRIVNTSATAIYNVSYTVASIMLIFWNSIDASYAPWIYQKLESNNFSSIRKRGNQIITLFAGMTFLATLFAPEIIMVLAPKNYYDGIYVIPSVAAGVFFTALYSLYMRVELYLKESKFTMYASVIAAATNLFLNFIFIPIYGMYAAGYTTLVCYIILSIGHYLILKKLDRNDLYDNKFIVGISLLIVLSSIFISIIYKFNLLRYLLMSIILIVILFKRKYVMKIIKNK